MKKVAIKKKINNSVETFYPKTSADIVQYDTDRTVTDVLDELLSSVAALFDAIEVTLTDSSSQLSISEGGIIITDSDDDTVMLINDSTNSVYGDVPIDDGSGDNVILIMPSDE